MEKSEQTVAVVAVNKFMYYSWNYDMEETTWRDDYGQEQSGIIPSFLKEVPWSFGVGHAVAKWNEAVKYCNDPHGYFSHFYAELDGVNRQNLITWIMENYDNEVKI